jgi:hypothetical protein
MAISHDQFIRNGDAWVGVTSKPISVVAMKAFNPTRYALLSWANPVPENDPQNCTMVAGDSARTTENGLIWDVLRQVGAWVKSRERSNPLNYGRDSQTTVQGEQAFHRSRGWRGARTGSTEVGRSIVSDAASPLWRTFLLCRIADVSCEDPRAPSFARAGFC